MTRVKNRVWWEKRPGGAKYAKGMLPLLRRTNFLREISGPAEPEANKNIFVRVKCWDSLIGVHRKPQILLNPQNTSTAPVIPSPDGFSSEEL